MVQPQTTHENARRIAAFYAAFAELDAERMAALYAPDARFEDPVFALEGRERIVGMWRMLCESAASQGRDVWALEASGIKAGDHAGRAHWEARYCFSATGRGVHNRIDACFEFRDGLVVRHVDRFDVWRWSRQALGLPGWLFGWSGPMQRALRTRAGARLDAWMNRSR